MRRGKDTTIERTMQRLLRHLVGSLVQRPAAPTAASVRALSLSSHYRQTEPPPNDPRPDLSEGEIKLKSLLRTRFPKATEIVVVDISGGCGAMYHVSIEAEDFRGMRTVAQHRLVNEVLKNEIPKMHGLQISTKVPDPK